MGALLGMGWKGRGPSGVTFQPKSRDTKSRGSELQAEGIVCAVPEVATAWHFGKESGATEVVRARAGSCGACWPEEHDFTQGKIPRQPFSGFLVGWC